MKIVGIYMLIFSAIYIAALIVVLSLRRSWSYIKEYQSIKSRGYIAKHKEKETKDNIYHSRLSGTVKRRRSVSEDARRILDNLEKEDSSFEDSVVVEEEIEENILPEYMVEKVAPQEKMETVEPSNDEFVLREDAPHKGTAILKNKDTGVLDSQKNNKKGVLRNDLTSVLHDSPTGILERNDGTGLLRSGTALLEEKIDFNKTFSGN